ncbi:glycosyltransferase family 4 protein [Hymenobacter caeli]|uniref:Glycosyltransferase involved in cell wall biosynthesis n=1 Tax=Hymenobacter caeli TaxID=2735894 RepID=A0ABX2FQ75_9BACT|nr:glycosyltransferase family 4 protein [Hymenobacter caeli]NRT19320.1 glycosyltransferase involved in cell wall biosynthesis [Hymenobacter caeli]
MSHRFSPEIGGIEVNSEIYARAFVAAGHSVRVATWSVAAQEDAFPFAVVRNPNGAALFKAHTWADVVFENNPCIRLGWPGLLHSRPAVVVLNTELYLKGKGWLNLGWVKRAWLRRARTVVSVSEAVRKQFWPAASVIGNPYRAHAFRVLPGIARTGNFMFMGRLVSQKGASLAVAAFHRVLARLAAADPAAPGPLLTIVGDGPERGNLEQQVDALGLRAHVHFKGFIEGPALAEELNRHRFLLVPSLYGEAFGNVVLEGMACGCVPIVSDSDGLPDAAGKAGFVFRRGDVDALADAISHVLSSPAIEQQLRAAAPAHLAAHLPDVVARRYLKLLEAAHSGGRKS